eukprot:scaffold71014_cov32-Tisochrysis_lutea.AAC.7
MSAPGPCSPLKLNAATAAKWMRNGSTIGPKRGESNAMPPLKSRSDPRTAGSHCESRSSVQPSIASQRSACSCACSPARSRSMTAAGLSHTRLLSTALRMVRASCVSSPAEGQLLNAGTLITSCQPPRKWTEWRSHSSGQSRPVVVASSVAAVPKAAALDASSVASARLASADMPLRDAASPVRCSTSSVSEEGGSRRSPLQTDAIGWARVASIRARKSSLAKRCSERVCSASSSENCLGYAAAAAVAAARAAATIVQYSCMSLAVRLPSSTSPTSSSRSGSSTSPSGKTLCCQ